MATVQGLIDQVKSEAQFDVTDAQALAWLDRRHKRMVVRARALRKTVSIGPTVIGTQEYALPADLVEIEDVLVGGMPYGQAQHSDLAYGAQGWVQLSGIGGVVAAEESSSGDPAIALYPTPTDAGLAVDVRGTFRPSDLVVGSDSTIKVPDEYLDSLVSGAIATGLARQENRPDLAQGFEQDFEQGSEEWRRQVRRRYRGSGPTPIRIRGVNV